MKKKKPEYRKLFFSAVLSLAIFCFFATGMFSTEALSFQYAVKKLLFPLTRLMFYITIGLAAGEIIEIMGWTEKVAVVARPLFRFSNLGNRCSAAFTTAFISGAAANAMLLDFFEEKKISKTQLFLTNYVNQLPVFFLHLPTTFFIVIPLTGFAGVLYFILTFAATLLRTICFLLFGYFHPCLKKSCARDNSEEIKSENTQKSEGVIKRITAKLPARVINIAVFVLPIYTLVFVLNANGFFEYLNKALSNYLTVGFMPVESLSVVILSFASEFTSGFAAAGALMDAGLLTTKQTVIALLIGNVTAFPIRALRHQLPRYMGIFAPKMGLQLLLSGQFFRISSIIIVGLIYYMAA
ncbi:MAG: nucleoside recognition protein [Thermodesulfobacteriota bacterium]|nr:nucleoside recognition protein [Thermodesulfobacteriota bacterium]